MLPREFRHLRKSLNQEGIQAKVAAPAKTKDRRGSVWSLLAGMWGAFFGILALWTVWGSPVDTGSQPAASKPAVVVTGEPQSPNQPVREASQPQFAAKAIRDIFPIADRVVARNPEEEPSPFDAADFELASLSDEELAELDTELLDALEDEPLPALIDGISDDSELFAIDTDTVVDTDATDDGPDDASFAKAEELYERLVDAAQIEGPTASDNHAESTDYGPFVREHWRVIRFRLTRPDGDQVRIWLARPAWWVEAERVHAGGKYEFDMEEVGAVGFADVLSIDECPEAPTRQNADHHLVTGKFEHDATNVINLYVAGEDDPIGTTANHPFWSDDRQAFVEAATLRPGEHLINAKGERVRVITHSPRPGPHTVYNLEVDGEHVYKVGGGGILAHNSCSTPHGYAIINKTTGEIIKFGVSRAKNGLTSLGNSVRGQRQLSEVAKKFGGKASDYEVVVLRKFADKTSMFRWEKEVVGIWKAMKHKLRGNIRPKGINPFIP